MHLAGAGMNFKLHITKVNRSKVEATIGFIIFALKIIGCINYLVLLCGKWQNYVIFTEFKRRIRMLSFDVCQQKPHFRKML